jgi:hypothetical protein
VGGALISFGATRAARVWSAPRLSPTRARAAAVVAVGSTAARASGASRWPFSVALAVGAAAAWPLCATLQRSFPAAVTVAAAAIAAAVAAAAIAAAANANVPLLCEPHRRPPHHCPRVSACSSR